MINDFEINSDKKNDSFEEEKEAKGNRMYDQRTNQIPTTL